MKGHLGTISVDVYNLDVGVFSSHAARIKFLRKQGCSDPAGLNCNGLAGAGLDEADDGRYLLTIVITEKAGMAEWAHECSHIADFICDVVGVPISLEATEARAYLVGHIFAGLQDILK